MRQGVQRSPHFIAAERFECAFYAHIARIARRHGARGVVFARGDYRQRHLPAQGAFSYVVNHFSENPDTHLAPPALPPLIG